MVVDGAREQPVSRVVGHHGGGGAGGGEQAHRVRVVVHRRQDLAVEVDRMHVHLQATHMNVSEMVVHDEVSV